MPINICMLELTEFWKLWYKPMFSGKNVWQSELYPDSYGELIALAKVPHSWLPAPCPITLAPYI